MWMRLRSVRTYAMVFGAHVAHVSLELAVCGARRGTAFVSQRIVFLTPAQDRRFSWTTEVGGVPSGSIGGDTANRFSCFRQASLKASEDTLISDQPRNDDSIWREQLEGIRWMRRSRDADVDFSGAGALRESSVGNDDGVRFQVLMSAMLSSQTRDPVTAAALERMRKACAPAPLGAAELADALDEDSLAGLLHPVSFFRTKAKHVLLVSRRLAVEEGDRAAGAIPDTVEGLLDLPGMGPKMAYLVMDLAWGQNKGICVDTHVHRISNRLGWVDTWNRSKPKSQNLEKTRKHLQAWLPREHWSEVNGLLVGFGQQVCRAVGPSCSTCGIRDICPSAVRNGDLSRPPRNGK